MLHWMCANSYSSQNSDKTGVCRAEDGNTHQKKPTTKTQRAKKAEEGEVVSEKVARKKKEKNKGFS